MTGYEINWNTTSGNRRLFIHPLYIKYNSKTFGTINVNEVKADLLGVMATQGSQDIIAYLSWIIRTFTLAA
jgi:hypothetical protein